MTGLNGLSITAVALAGALAAAVSSHWVGFIAGIAISCAGFLEYHSHRILKRNELQGIRWALWSQVGVFSSIAAYCLAQLSVLSRERAVDLVSPASKRFLMELYQVDESILGDLLYLTAMLTYPTLLLASFLYQGGLYWYYRRLQGRIG